MKHIDRVSEAQRRRTDKRFKKGGWRPYWGPTEPCEIAGMELKHRLPLKFQPPIYAEWRRW